VTIEQPGRDAGGWQSSRLLESLSQSGIKSAIFRQGDFESCTAADIGGDFPSVGRIIFSDSLDDVIGVDRMGEKPHPKIPAAQFLHLPSLDHGSQASSIAQDDRRPHSHCLESAPRFGKNEIIPR
jgi:hypothetical protein